MCCLVHSAYGKNGLANYWSPLAQWLSIQTTSLNVVVLIPLGALKDLFFEYACAFTE